MYYLTPLFIVSLYFLSMIFKTAAGQQIDQRESEVIGSTIIVNGVPLPVSPSNFGEADLNISITPGRHFASRMIGGGTRADIYGTHLYGSGYPGMSTPGVKGRGFPFFYWPVSYCKVQYHDCGDDPSAAINFLYTAEYGKPANSSRPGGPLTTAQFHSKISNSTYHLLADEGTIHSLISSVQSNCSPLLSGTVSTAPYNGTNSSPEEAVQYYRASSVVLALSDFDNSCSATAGQLYGSLPTGTDLKLLQCLNSTVGQTVPLADATKLIELEKAKKLVVFFMILVLIVMPSINHLRMIR
ncbi:hypothetical protein BDQ17DRAFT_1378257 [Cyathus striatus]|nr:hypothetical protein BDQ17DRAFT_1378257 [Cyathus striatus]